MPEQILDVTDRWEYDFFQALVPNYLAEMERNQNLLGRFITILNSFITQSQSLLMEDTASFRVKPLGSMNLTIKGMIRTTIEDSITEMKGIKKQLGQICVLRSRVQSAFRRDTLLEMRSGVKSLEQNLSKTKQEIAALEKSKNSGASESYHEKIKAIEREKKIEWLKAKVLPLSKKLAEEKQKEFENMEDYNSVMRETLEEVAVAMADKFSRPLARLEAELPMKGQAEVERELREVQQYCSLSGQGVKEKDLDQVINNYMRYRSSQQE